MTALPDYPNEVVTKALVRLVKVPGLDKPEKWKVENYDGIVRGEMPLKEALWWSDNTVFTDLVMNAGGKGLEDGPAVVIDVLAQRLEECTHLRPATRLQRSPDRDGDLVRHRRLTRSPDVDSRSVNHATRRPNSQTTPR